MICFTLTMPNVGSWNGKFSGADKLYAIVLRFKKEKEIELNGKSFYYNFGDGWGALVSCTKVDGKEAARIRKKSSGFMGYNWMIDEIIDFGKILSLSERRDNRRGNQ